MSRSASTKPRLSLCPTLDAELVAESILERQRHELAELELGSEAKDSLMARQSTTAIVDHRPSLPSLLKRRSGTLSIVDAGGSMSHRSRAPSERSGQDELNDHDEMDIALLPKSLLFLMEEEMPQPRQRTRMEELVEQAQQSRGRRALATTQGPTISSKTKTPKLTSTALHQAVSKSLKHNGLMLKQINTSSAMELEVKFRKDANGEYEDDDEGEDPDNPALNRLRNRQMFNKGQGPGQGSIRFRPDGDRGPGTSGPSMMPATRLKSIRAQLMRDGIGDDSMSIRVNSGMRHVIDSFTSASIKTGSMRRVEGSMRRSAAYAVINGQSFPSISGGHDPQFDPSILLQLKQSFADAADSRLKLLEESIQPRRKPKNQLPMAPTLPLPSEMAPPRELHTREGVRYSGAFGRPSEMQQKLAKEKILLIKANPAAFQPDVADRAEARHQTMVEVARMRYDDSVKSQFQDKEVDEFFKSLTGLRVARPFFLPPIYEKEKVQRERVVGGAKRQKTWSLEASLFAMRMKETESKTAYDDEKIRKAQFDLDWTRVVSKERFRRQIGIVERGKSKSKKNMEEELNEVQEEIFLAKDSLRSIFIYYSCDNGPMDSGDALTMTLDKWLSFCTDVGLMESMSRNELQRIFAAVNFEEAEGDPDANEENDDNAMMRFEFLEGIIRTAFGRYIYTNEMKDASDACKLFLGNIVLSQVPKEALVDPNAFRRDRLYNREVEGVLLEYQGLLSAIYRLYKSRDKSKFFWIEHWAAFLEAMCLIGPHTGLDRQSSKLLFFYSQAIVSDELKRRKRAVGLVFFDFLEAISRLAEFISPVSTSELLELRPVGGNAGEQRERHLVILREMSMVGDRPGNRSRPGSSGASLSRTVDRPISAGIVSKPTRHLAVKLRYLLEYLSAHSVDAWGGKTMQETVERMLEEVETLSRGIELG